MFPSKYYDLPMIDDLGKAFESAMLDEHTRAADVLFCDGFMLVYCMGGEL